MRKAVPLVAFCALLFTARVVHADTLGRVERSHQSSSSSGSSDSGRGSGRSGASAGVRLVTGILSAFFRSSGRSSTRSDGAGWSPPGLAIEPYEERSRSIYVARSEERHRITRSAELAMSGWYAPRPRLYAHALDLRGWLGPVVFHGGWTRFHEPGSMSLDALDAFRARIGLNVLAGSSSMAELTPLVGVLALRGNDVTPAFDAGADLRIYPVRPLVVAASFQAAFFKDGPAFLETRLEPGVSISRLDLRLGAMWVYQARAISSLGPSATIAVRW